MSQGIGLGNSSELCVVACRCLRHSGERRCIAEVHHCVIWRKGCNISRMVRAPQKHAGACSTLVMELLRTQAQKRARAELVKENRDSDSGRQGRGIHGAAGPGADATGPSWRLGLGAE